MNGTIALTGRNETPRANDVVAWVNVYWAGKSIQQQHIPQSQTGSWVETDRLGSVRGLGLPEGTSNALYLPYGEELAPTGNWVVKFATYTRNENTGLDYADQRYYTSKFGRFMTSDPFEASSEVSNP